MATIILVVTEIQVKVFISALEMFSPRFPSPGRTVQMEREHHVSPQNKWSGPQHLPAQDALWILSPFKLLLSPSVPPLRGLSLPEHLVLTRPLPSCWLWVLLTKFFHPFHHPQAQQLPLRKAHSLTLPKRGLAEGHQAWNGLPTIPEDAMKGSSSSSVTRTLFAPQLLKSTGPPLSFFPKSSHHRQTQSCDK